MFMNRDETFSWLWDFSRLSALRSFAHSPGQKLNCAAFSSDSKTVLTGSYKLARLWDLQSGKPILSIDDFPKEMTLGFLAYSKDGSRIITGEVYYGDQGGGGIQRFRTWSLDGRLLQTVNDVAAYRATSAGFRVLDHNGDLWDLENGVVLTRLCGLKPNWDHSDISEDGQMASISDQSQEQAESNDDVLRVWQRRRPEYWWGVAWLPEFWLTALFAGALGWSVWRDGRLGAGKSGEAA
jgi:WD40 repeat protein